MSAEDRFREQEAIWHGWAPTKPQALTPDELFQLQDRRCYLCLRAFGRRNTMGAPTLDHVHPRALGGANVGNLLLAHRFCNELKADRRPMPCETIFLAAINAMAETQDIA